MTPFTLLPVILAVLFVAFTVFITLKSEGYIRNAWIFPAALSLAFLIYSLLAVFVEGPFGFWAEHTRNLWGVQIWFDLLLAVGIGWFFIVPHARELRMNIWFWLVIVVCTGCIGFLAMVSRMLYLRERSGDRGRVAS